MKEERDLFTEFIQIAVLTFIVGVLLFEELTNQGSPCINQVNLSDVTFGRSLHRLSFNRASVDPDHGLPRRPGLAIHVVPHVELMNRLVQRDL